jgi:hypothetical protein
MIRPWRWRLAANEQHLIFCETFFFVLFVPAARFSDSFSATIGRSASAADDAVRVR